jgi:putative ABC transport system ATP-binding protein
MTHGVVFDIRELVIHKQSDNTGFELVVPHLTVRHAEMIAVIGPSGCGKSTLLDVLAMAAPVVAVGRFVFTPNGEQEIDVGRLLQANKLDALADIRRLYVGYVLQTGGLLPFLDVEANIGLICAEKKADRRRRVSELAADLGIEYHLHKKPAALSAGERQRVAIGRALAHRPAAIIADEPTAALDPATSDTVMALFVQQVTRVGVSCVVATHDWNRVERLGLRHLHQHLADSGRPGWIRSIMHD